MMNDDICMICGETNKLVSPKKDICNECFVKLNKKCKECLQVKKITQFHIRRNNCKVCQISKVMKNTEKRKQQADPLIADNP